LGTYTLNSTKAPWSVMIALQCCAYRGSNGVCQCRLQEPCLLTDCCNQENMRRLTPYLPSRSQPSAMSVSASALTAATASRAQVVTPGRQQRYMAAAAAAHDSSSSSSQRQLAVVTACQHIQKSLA
jgi:hypothetical protein